MLISMITKSIRTHFQPAISHIRKKSLFQHMRSRHVNEKQTDGNNGKRISFTASAVGINRCKWADIVCKYLSKSIRNKTTPSSLTVCLPTIKAHPAPIRNYESPEYASLERSRPARHPKYTKVTHDCAILC